jgi:hypothetical protein
MDVDDGDDLKKPSQTVIDILHSYANPQYLVTDAQLDEIRFQRDDADTQRHKKEERKKVAANRKQEREDATKALTASIIETTTMHQEQPPQQAMVDIVPQLISPTLPTYTKPIATPSQPPQQANILSPILPLQPTKPIPTHATDLYDFSNLLVDDTAMAVSSPCWAPVSAAAAAEEKRLEEEAEERERRCRRRQQREKEEQAEAAEAAAAGSERNERRQRRKESEKQESASAEEKEQRAKELERWRSKISKKKVLTQKQFGIALGFASSAIETSAEFLGSRYARLNNLSKNVETALLAGDFDESIEQVSASPAAISVLENPMVSFGTTFASILVDTHLENSRKSLSTSVNEFRGRVQVTRSEMGEFKEWQRFKQQQQEQPEQKEQHSETSLAPAQRNSIGKSSVQKLVEENKINTLFGADIDISKDTMQTIRNNMQKMQPMMSSMSNAASLWQCGGDDVVEEESKQEDADVDALVFA